MLLVLLSIWASLLPASWRKGLLSDHDVNVHRGALISGIAESVITLYILVMRYPGFLHSRQVMAEAALNAKGLTDKFAQGVGTMSITYLALFEYLFLPSSILLLYFAIEGIVRIFAEVGSNEIVPSVPFQLLYLLQRFGQKVHRRRFLGPLVVDQVELGATPGFDLRIVSCRPKEWDHLLTVSYNGVMYELDRAEDGEAPRRFIYYLRRIPPNKLIRGLHHYDPAEPLKG